MRAAVLETHKVRCPLSTQPSRVQRVDLMGTGNYADEDFDSLKRIPMVSSCVRLFKDKPPRRKSGADIHSHSYINASTTRSTNSSKTQTWPSIGSCSPRSTHYCITTRGGFRKIIYSPSLEGENGMNLSKHTVSSNNAGIANAEVTVSKGHDSGLNGGHLGNGMRSLRAHHHLYGTGIRCLLLVGKTG